MDLIPEKPKSPKIFDQKINNETGKSNAGMPNVWELFGLGARPRELTRNQKIQKAQEAVETADLRKKITETAESNKNKKDPYENVFDGHKQIKTKKLLYSLVRTSGKKLASDLGIAEHLVNSRTKRIELGKQLLGGNISSFTSARSIKQKLIKLNRDPQAKHRDEIADKIFNEGKQSNWEAVRKEKELLKKMLGDKK